MGKRLKRTVRTYVELEEHADGSVVMSLRHPTHRGQWAKIKVVGGSGHVVKRAVEAVYDDGEGDADCYLKAYGMSDGEAFATGDDNPWTDPGRRRR